MFEEVKDFFFEVDISVETFNYKIQLSKSVK